MASQIPRHHWQEFKKELMEKWHELTEHEIERTKGNYKSLSDLLEKKLGNAIEDASEKLAEIASRYRLYDEPKEIPKKTPTTKNEKVLELRPPKKKDRVKPRQDLDR